MGRGTRSFEGLELAQLPDHGTLRGDFVIPQKTRFRGDRPRHAGPRAHPSRFGQGSIRSFHWVGYRGAAGMGWAR